MKPLKLKSTVHVNGTHFYTEMVRILDVARETAPDTSDGFVWVTSANDSAHMKGSLHYRDRAFDIRTVNLLGGDDAAKSWLMSMKTLLGKDYDIKFEGDHLHVEFDPK
jgi:hypothetical protein